MTWQRILQQNIRSIEKLSEFLELDESSKNALCTNRFPLNLPLRLAQKIKKNCLTDPLFLQFVQLKGENNHLFVQDPTEDCAFHLSPKLLKKYEKRALLITSSACAMHCRYCFRQNFPYESEKGFEQELQLIQNDNSINEVILSGGDPLSLSNRALISLLTNISKIAHIKRIRFHSRFLIGIPERVDEELRTFFAQTNLTTYFVLHCNHPKEIDNDVIASVKKLQKVGVLFLNQAVLLKGVNDSVEVLEELVELLMDIQVIPYYLHQLDRVKGAEYFEVQPSLGKELIKQLRERVSGFGVFTYVEEIPHKKSKTPFEVYD